MAIRTIDDVKRLWSANEDLWNTNVYPKVVLPLVSGPGLSTGTSWKHIVAVAFGRSLETFQSVQLLSNPDLTVRLWSDAFISTRGHFETYITLRWIAQNETDRVNLFLDEFTLIHAHILDNLRPEHRDLVRPERQKAIEQARAEVLKRRNLGNSRLRLLPSLEQRVSGLNKQDTGTKPADLNWEYQIYYRDVSSFAHLSGWGLFTGFPLVSGPTKVEPSPEIGFKALLCNGGLFLRILQLWNEVFRVLPDAAPYEWLSEWEAKIH